MPSTRARRRALAVAGAAALTVWLLAGCDSLSFSAANLPAYFSGVRRADGIAYAAGERGKLDVYSPGNGRSPARRPVIVFFYGGSWTGGRRADYRFVATALVKLGYVVVVPDYRVYPAVRFPDFMADGAAAVAWTVQHGADYGGDAAHLVLMGHSAGAYIAAMLSVEPSYLQRAGVQSNRIAALITLSGPMYLRPNTETLHRIFGAPYGPGEWQATARVRQRGPPALIVHGRDDALVGVDNSERFAGLLRAQGGTATLKIYDHCDHVCTVAALSVPARRRAPTLADISAFLDSLGLKPD
jgi:acetyl esterase/lipase